MFNHTENYYSTKHSTDQFCEERDTILYANDFKHK